MNDLKAKNNFGDIHYTSNTIKNPVLAVILTEGITQPIA